MGINLPSTSNVDSEKHQLIFITEEEFREPITDEYAKRLSELSPDEIYDHYNPGPTLPDGSVNFECHCVSHLVASPCGYEFRSAISCQKGADDEDLKEGKCAEEFVSFMKCVMETKCFRAKDDDEDEKTDVPAEIEEPVEKSA
uniref:CHCH domain-containing protein n=1 Tax=Acrobeloides nanus TaxID=290746 RepID=A0A914C5H0_9BILA